MAPVPKRLLLVSCRHCLRPVTVAGEIDELEREELRRHLRGCVTTDPGDVRLEADDVLRHFRVADDP
jgi:hypothetical protein